MPLENIVRPSRSLPSVYSWPDLWQWSIRRVNTMSCTAESLSDADLVRQAKLLKQDGDFDPVGCSGSIFENS